MKFTVNNINYCATVVKLKSFVELDNCNNLKTAIIFGNSVIVSKDSKAGDIGLFFPLETALSKEFLGANNLYRKAEFGNANPDSRGGFFEAHGRVRAVKFRGHKSEGFFIGLFSLTSLGFNLTDFNVGDEFNTIDNIEICKKYVAKTNMAAKSKTGQAARAPRFSDVIVENQFRFHYDTGQFKKNLHKFNNLNTIISISDKWHGTSVVISHILTNRPLAWYEKLLVKAGVKLNTKQYSVVASSRKVIKSVDTLTKDNETHYYSDDIWSIVKEEVKHCVPKGFTIYGEIVGYTPSGSAIQKDYSYGCDTNEHRLLVYRVTFTNEDGKVIELYWNQMLDFCWKYGLIPVVEHFYGTIREFFNTIPAVRDVASLLAGDEVSSELLNQLTQKYLEKPCRYNNSRVPAEGIVVRIDELEESSAFKLKSFAFLEKETKDLDKNIQDTETRES